jgi:hypothetical protein
MKISFSAVIVLLTVSQSTAFSTSSTFNRLPTTLESSSSSTNIKVTSDSSSASAEDVSIPYDAAAKLAYDEWRQMYNKGEYSEAKFERFKDNYKILTVANISAAKKAKDAGEEAPKKMDLNEFADMTFEEYAAMNNEDAMEVEAEAETKSDDVSPLSTALDALQAQDAASESLGEAAAAIAAEEQVRV